MFMYHYMIMTRFYCHLCNYGEIIELRCPISYHYAFFLSSKATRVCTCLLFFFHFQYKLIVFLKKFVFIFEIWVKDFVCKLSEFLTCWTLKELGKREELMFLQRIFFNSLECPLYFPLPLLSLPLSLYIFLFQQQFPIKTNFEQEQFQHYFFFKVKQ